MTIPDQIYEIIEKKLLGTATETDCRELEKWFNANREHQDIFQDMILSYYQGKYTLKWDKIDQDKAWKVIEKKGSGSKRSRTLRIIASVAASVLLVVGMIFLFSEKPQDLPPQSISHLPGIKPGEAKALLLLPDGREIVLERDSLLKWEQYNMEVGIIGNRLNYTYHNILEERVDKKTPVYHTLIVPHGGEYVLTLSDGTVVYLNAGSSIQYPMRFVSNSRKVILTGEAYFEVARDSSAPFVVSTHDADIKVLGTSFNVMAYAEDPRMEVTLVEGKINVCMGEVQKILKPEQQISIQREDKAFVVNEVNVHTFIDWKDGILNFDAMPLKELTLRLSRWYNVRFEFTSGISEELIFSGAFKKYNDIDYILSLIENTTNVTFETNNDVIIVKMRE